MAVRININWEAVWQSVSHFGITRVLPALLRGFKWLLIVELLLLAFELWLVQSLARGLRRNPQFLTLGMRPWGALAVIKWGLSKEEWFILRVRKVLGRSFQHHYPEVFHRTRRLFPP